MHTELIEPHLPVATSRHFALGTDYQVCPQTDTLYFYGAQEKAHYEQNYFMEEYKKQYGRDYLEDEPKLRELAKRRLRMLSSYLDTGSSLLEIGSAAGFFIDEAAQAGYHAFGVEVSSYAASYAQDTFQLKVYNESFLSTEIQAQSIDAICAFYVLEHIPKQKSIFAKIATCLKSGGVLCFALPSLHGPTFTKNKMLWKEQHPTDHFVDYSPHSLRKVLDIYDLNLVKIQPAAYHPQRSGKLYQYKGLHTLYRLYADYFCYGDTMEGIAIKK